MKIDEQLWRVFQSKFAKLLNGLTKDEQAQYFVIFKLREELENSFNFQKIESMMAKRISEKRNERKRTRFLRKLLAKREENKQKTVLIEAAKAYARGVFYNKIIILNNGINERVVAKTKIEIENTTRGCELYPCRGGISQNNDFYEE